MASIDQMELYAVDIPLLEPIRIALGVIPEARLLVIRLRSSDGCWGWGEACPYTTIVGETRAGQWAMAQELAPLLIGCDPYSIESNMELLQRALPGNHTLMSAFDMALHDLAAKMAGLSLTALLGGDPNRECWSDNTVYLDTTEAMVKRALEFCESGYRQIKIKVGRGEKPDLETVNRIREQVGPEVVLRLDANQGWTRPLASRLLLQLAPLGIEYCEQPLVREDQLGLIELAAQSPIPLMADESLFDEYDAFALARSGCNLLFNIKLAKSGGILRARRILAVARAAFIPCQIGCMGESRLGLSASAHLATVGAPLQYYDLDGNQLHAADPVIGGMSRAPDGKIRLPSGPGLGAEFDPSFLKRMPKEVIQ